MATSCSHLRQRQFLRFGGSLQELREQLHQEIENKAKACANPTYECSLPRADGSEYCMQHVLRDAHGNYRHCTFIYANGRKCPNALQKHDIKKDPEMTTLCFEHNRQAQLRKTHTTVGKFKRTDTNEALLHNLSNHINVDDKQFECSNSEQDEEIDVVSPYVTPFGKLKIHTFNKISNRVIGFIFIVAHEQINKLDSVMSKLQKRRRILEYASDSSSDYDERPSIRNTACSFEFNESDDDSDNSLAEDLLKYVLSRNLS